MLGFAPHSGWAAVVVVAGEIDEPEVLARGRVDMTDPRLPGSKQPYHEVEDLPLQEAERRLARLSHSAGAMAYEAIRALLEEIGARGSAAGVAGILDSSGRKGDGLAAILASHALIHTADGNHFRDALADACRRCELEVARVRQRDLIDRAVATLRKPPGQLAATVRALGQPLGAPWGADQKSAATLAWLLLAAGQAGTPPRSR
ncbi:MAG: hypothetical protein DMF51_12210 [Acidobacteria bacterium]|nr:MAG: hypothetical protein DMF51_12210 [Acidobacteriota bacterium]